MSTLAERVTTLFEQGTSASRDEARDVFLRLRDELSFGTVRAAEPDPSSPTGWRVNVWVKQGILLGFRFGDVVDMGVAKGRWSFYDKDTLPMRRFDASSGVRIVPGGSAVREGAYLGAGVICMPPMYINVGAYVGDGTLVDSHALVGSCAQIGRKVHLSAAAQIGGVLEPVGAVGGHQRPAWVAEQLAERQVSQRGGEVPDPEHQEERALLVLPDVDELVGAHERARRVGVPVEDDDREGQGQREGAPAVALQPAADRSTRGDLVDALPRAGLSEAKQHRRRRRAATFRA